MSTQIVCKLRSKRFREFPWRNKFPARFDDYQRLNSDANFENLAKSLVNMWLDCDQSGYPNKSVARISCELLIVRGDDDHLVSKETVVELARHVKNSRLLNIPFADHVAFDDQPDLFMLSFDEFFRTTA
jgi:pimeloyl-ACP methyl ester carboxylesterase